MSLINAERVINAIRKRMTEAGEQKRNHAYIKGLRDAARIVDELKYQEEEKAVETDV